MALSPVTTGDTGQPEGHKVELQLTLIGTGFEAPFSSNQLEITRSPCFSASKMPVS